MATRGMGAALKKGGMSKMKKIHLRSCKTLKRRKNKMAKDRMTTSSPEYKTMMLKKVYDYALKNTDSDRLTIKDIKAAQQAAAKEWSAGAKRKRLGMGLMCERKKVECLKEKNTFK
jgi:lysozyme family protein